MSLFKLVGIPVLPSPAGLHSLATDIATGKRQNRLAGPLIIDSNTDLSEFDISSSESDASSLSCFVNERNSIRSTSEIQELISAIKAGLDNLFKASIFIRKFAPNDKRQRASATKPFDNRADVMYVKDRYSLLAQKNEALTARLGEANARRRQYFKYCRDHNDRLSRAPDEKDTLKSETMPKKQPETRPAKSVTTVQTKPSLFAGTEATAFIAGAGADAQISELLDAPPAMSVVSFATSIAEASSDELPFPPIPADAHRNSLILCPYCLRIVQMKRGNLEHQWRFELRMT